MAAPGAAHIGEVFDVTSEEALHLREYWNILVQRRWTVILCTIIIFATAAIWVLKQKRQYTASVLLEINPEESNTLNFRQWLQVNNTDQDTFLETQYRILKSRTLAERAVQELDLERVPEFYQSHGLFARKIKLPPVAPGMAVRPKPNSPAYRNAVAHLLGSLDVYPIRQSNLVRVAFTSQDPHLAARVANQLAADYIDENYRVKWEATMNASNWLENQLVQLKARLETSEYKLQQYAKDNSIIFVGKGASLANDRLEQLQEQYTKAQAARFQIEAQYSLVQSGRLQDLPGFLDNRLIEELQDELVTLRQKYADMTSVVKPSYPTAVALKRQIDTVQKSLNTQVSTLTQNIVQQYHSALARENYLAEAITAQEKVVNEDAQKAIQYNILEREVKTNRQLYQDLLERMKEAQVTAGLKASNVRIVDAADLPLVPSKPRVVMDLALALILGLAAGIGLALLQEYLDDTFKNPDEVQVRMRLPSLGALPQILFADAKKEKSRTSIELRRTQTAPALTTNPQSIEAFRNLRTSILLSASPVPRVVLVTSALPSEGKTTVSMNLGATLASLGSRVVIVDCDMRRPAVHRSAGVSNRTGISQYLTGQAALRDIIQPVASVKGLSVATSGPIPPNPAEILQSPLAAEMMRTLRADFDYVLVDSPPLLSVSDSRILATVVDGVVLVIRACATPHGVARRARDLLAGSGARVLGVALNGIDFQKNGYGYYYRYGYGYGYGYGHGYGYGADEADEEQGETSTPAEL